MPEWTVLLCPSGGVVRLAMELRFRTVLLAPMPVSTQDTPSGSPAPDRPEVKRLGWTRVRVVLEYWRPLVIALLCIQVPLLVLNRFELPLGISFGYRSFTRNIAIVMVLGVWLGARGLPRPRSILMSPMLVFFAAIWLSVAVNGGRWADVRSFGFTVGLFYGASSLARSADARRFLFHWLGALVVLTVLSELYGNPEILQFRQALRNTMVTAHPNTLGGFFALMAPLFLGALDDKSARRLAPLYVVFAIFGAALTFSRLSLAGLFVGAGTVLAVVWLRRYPMRVLGLGVAAAVLAVASILYLSLGRAEADWQRLNIIYASLTIFAENWLLGIGFGVENLEVVFPGRYDALFGKKLWLYHSHNMYVDVLVASGVLGGACAAWLFYRLSVLAWRAVEASQEDPRIRRVGAGFAGATVVFFLLGVGDMPLYHERLLFPLAIAWGLMDGWGVWAQSRPS